MITTIGTLMVRFLDLPVTLIVLANQAGDGDVTSLAMKIGETLLSAR